MNVFLYSNRLKIYVSVLLCRQLILWQFLSFLSIPLSSIRVTSKRQSRCSSTFKFTTCHPKKMVNIFYTHWNSFTMIVFVKMIQANISKRYCFHRYFVLLKLFTWSYFTLAAPDQDAVSKMWKWCLFSTLANIL